MKSNFLRLKANSNILTDAQFIYYSRFLSISYYIQKTNHKALLLKKSAVRIFDILRISFPVESQESFVKILNLKLEKHYFLYILSWILSKEFHG